MDWFKKSVVLAYFPRKDTKLKAKWVRLNWTIQDEWLSVSEVGLDDIIEAN